MSCASASFCVALDAHGNARTYDGSTWSMLEIIDPGPVSPIPPELAGSGINGLSCPSPHFGMAVDLEGRALTLSGS